MRPEDQLKAQPIQAVDAPVETVKPEQKIHLVLAYLGLFALIPLITVKDSPYVQWHAKNGLVLGIAGAVGLPILSAILGIIPFIGWVLSCTAVLAFVIVNVLAMVKALGGERWRIPFLTDLAEKL